MTSMEHVDLRRRAEKRVEDREAGRSEQADQDALRLPHEQEVHELELEIQDEELRAARLEVEVGLERYSEIFDLAPVGYLVIGEDERIVDSNLAGARLLGAERSGLLGQRVDPFVREVDRPAFARFVAQVFNSPAPESCELSLAPEGALLREVRLAGVSLAGTQRTVLIAIEDVTARKCAEGALRDEIRHKDEFLAALSHELRNPLAPIRNSLYVLERAAPEGQQAHRAQAVIDRQVGHLTHIVDDLLEVTRIARGKIRLQLSRVELGELVRSALDDYRPGLEAAGIALEARLGSEPCWVDADATRLVQILGNLLANALKFTPRGGKVEVDLLRDREAVTLSVRDTGVGIPPEIRPTLFQPFVQAPQASDRTQGGLGLGLATVKGLVELHGGTVKVFSEGVGRGAEFTVRLPLAAAPERAAVTVHQGDRRHHRVLVIEDNPDAADSLRDALLLSGHDVQVAYDGPTGLDMAMDSRPDAVICDIGLPGMDGYEVARTIRRTEALKATYVVALTGYALPEDLRRARESGFDRHVAKPPTIEKLEQILAEAPSLMGADVAESRARSPG
jgi:PAS domain S-box-containing protein